MSAAETALADEPVDVDWYTTREREYAEVLPWDHLDSGLDRDWLWEDWQDAVTGDRGRGLPLDAVLRLRRLPADGHRDPVGPDRRDADPADRAQLGARPGPGREPGRVTGSPETIHQRGRDAVLAGRALLDVPPAPGATRWGLSLVARPDVAAAERLQALAAEAQRLAGPGQWVTASPGSTHLTVTYLERTHREVGADDADVRRFADVVRRLAADVPPLRWQVTGLALADRGVLALAEPRRRRRRRAPGPGAARAGRGRPGRGLLPELGLVGHPRALRRSGRRPAGAGRLGRRPDCGADVPGDPVTADSVDVVRYEYDGARTVPVTLAAAALTGVPEGATDGAQA